MTADIEMLPLPELASERVFGAKWDDFDMQDYTRANVAHHTAAKDAEIEALRAEREVIVAEAVKYADKSGRLEAKAERLAEALRELRDLMLGQVKWMPCDCGCPQQRTPDGPHSVTWLRAAQQVEIAIGKAEAEDRG